MMSKFRTVRRIDNSRLRRPTAPERFHEMVRVVASGALVAGLMLLYAWQHFACIQLGYQMESLKTARTQAAELNQELKIEVAGLRSPSRIDTIARNRLGLTVPAAAQIAPFETPSEAVLAELRSPVPGRQR